jgi:hypothetical protein
MAAMIGRWGPQGAATVAQRLQELDAVGHLGDLSLLPYVTMTPGDRPEAVTVDGGDGVLISLELDLGKERPAPADARRRCTTAAIVAIVVRNDPSARRP